jgi:glycosyltransferase involved in cell wall biosynthesis
MRRVRKEIRNSDLVFVHAHYQFANLIGAWLARRAHKPYVIFTHASLHRQGIAHKSGLLKRVYLRVLEHGNLINSEFLAFNAPEEKASSLYSELGKVIPNGISPMEFADMPPVECFRERYPELNGQLCLLVLGRLDVQHKGLDMLIPAFAQLCQSFPAVHLVLAGPGENDGVQQVKDLACEYGVERSVTLTGLIEGKDKLAALQDADAFVLPSRFEGLSIALLEALYAGLPVLVTEHVGLCNEIVRENAGLVVSSSVDSIYKGLRQLMNCNTRDSMGSNGRKMILQKYTWDAIARQLMTDIATKM